MLSTKRFREGNGGHEESPGSVRVAESYMTQGGTGVARFSVRLLWSGRKRERRVGEEGFGDEFQTSDPVTEPICCPLLKTPRTKSSCLVNAVTQRPLRFLQERNQLIIQRWFRKCVNTHSFDSLPGPNQKYISATVCLNHFIFLFAASTLTPPSNLIITLIQEFVDAALVSCHK